MARCLVLLADDFEDARDVYAFFLRREGFDVQDLPDGEQLLERARELRPDVIVLDLTLPGMDGWTVLSRLRAHPVTAEVPVVILSGHDVGADERRALAAAVLRKPCPPDALAATLKRVSESCARAFGGGADGEAVA